MQEVELSMADGPCRTFLFTPDGEGPWPPVVVAMDALAIRPALFNLCQTIADMGYSVLLPDMFYRAGPYTPLDAKEVFASGDVVKTLAPLMSSTDPEKAAGDMATILEFADGLPSANAGKVAIVGYCMGGATAIMVAGLYPAKIAAAASFHAGFLVTEAPLSPHRLASAIVCPVYCGLAADDPHFTESDEKILRQAFDDADVDYVMEPYGAPHGWTMTDLPVYSPQAAARHFQRLGAFLTQSFDR